VRVCTLRLRSSTSSCERISKSLLSPRAVSTRRWTCISSLTLRRVELCGLEGLSYKHVRSATYRYLNYSPDYIWAYPLRSHSRYPDDSYLEWSCHLVWWLTPCLRYNFDHCLSHYFHFHIVQSTHRGAAEVLRFRSSSHFLRAELSLMSFAMFPAVRGGTSIADTWQCAVRTGQRKVADLDDTVIS
jgi:hypothetical protein